MPPAGNTALPLMAPLPLAAGQAVPVVPEATQVQLLKVSPLGTGSLTAVVTLCEVVGATVGPVLLV